jgi:hypothetical protein
MTGGIEAGSALYENLREVTMPSASLLLKALVLKKAPLESS